MLKIVNVPNKVLTAPVMPVKKIDDKIKNLVYEMEETLIAQVDPQGVGLAATQIGQSLALFIMRPDEDSSTEVCINPQILEIIETPVKKLKSTKKADTSKLEGCLSIPHIWSPLKRAKKVLMEYEDLNGEKKKEWFTGFKAIIVQHEVDHLNGILFTQRALEQNSPLYEEKEGELKKISGV